MKDYLKTFGPGTFTAGSKFLCFKKAASGTYENLAQAPEGKEESEEWFVFAELLADHLNKLKQEK